CALPMATPDMPVCDEWVAEIARVVERESGKGDEIILVGHSLGVCAILRYLEGAMSDVALEGAVLVSGPFESIGKSKIENFLDRPFDFAKIKPKIGKVAIIHGDNDPNVPPAHAEKFAEVFGVPVTWVANGGHLDGQSGWHTLPECLDAIM
ncbi:UNVERIFIED_CONTAM: serine hydrolase family protein, partial [Lactobacillus paragasseri]|nr:serine hydrolase family protein [Lactobacillus paragasseri]